MLFSCSNDINDIRDLNDSFIIPPNTISDFTLFFTDSGVVKIKLESPFLINNETNDEKKNNKEFPKGANVTFFDRNKNIENFMKADYCIYFTNINSLEARGNVIIVNKDNDSVLTEKIFWEQEKHLIYTQEYSRIIKNGQTIIGRNGFESNENLSWYKIYNTEGNIRIKDSLN